MAKEAESTKRKRTASVRREPSPVAKKQAKEVDEDARQRSRKVIKAIYRRYNILSGTKSDGKHLAFDALLDACEGEPAARRLAAKLIPKFTSQFPGKISVVARSLMELSAWDAHNSPENVQLIAEAARIDAFQGLADVCALNSDDSATDRTSASIVLHFLRCLHQPKAFKPSTPQRIPEHESVLKAIRRVFVSCPQAMMSACLEALSSGSGELYDAAIEALQNFIDTKAGSDIVSKSSSFLNWLRPALQKLKGKTKSSDLNHLLDRLLDSVDPQSGQSPKIKAEIEPKDEGRPQIRGDKIPERTGTSSPKVAEVEIKESEEAPPLPKDDSPVEEGSVPVRNERVLGRVESGELKASPTPEPRQKGKEEKPSSLLNPASVPEKSARVSGQTNPFSPDSLPKAGGACCLAFECLWLGGIQAHMVGETQIRRACEEYGPVKRIVFMYSCGQALVFFHEMSHTTACYEGMNGKVVLSRKPLTVQFCEDAADVANQPNPPLRLVVWVAMTDPQLQLEKVLNELRTSAVPKPTKIFTVAGNCPGALLHFPTAPAAAAAVVALRSSASRSPVRTKSPSRRSLSPRSPSGRRSPGRPAPASALPDFATKTLWIGQVGPDVVEDELIDSFKQHGRIVSYKLIRPSNCAFIDFERVEDAASARAALHEATFATCQIRVEFKEEGRALGRVGPTNFVPRGGPGGRMPRGRGRGRGRGDFEHWPGRDGPPGFRGRGRLPWRGGRGRFAADWNEPGWHERRERSPSPYRSRRHYSSGRTAGVSNHRGRDRRDGGVRGRPSPDYNEGHDQDKSPPRSSKRRRSSPDRSERRRRKSPSPARSRSRRRRPSSPSTRPERKESRTHPEQSKKKDT